MKIAIFGTKKWEQDYLREKIDTGALGGELQFFDGIVTKDTLPAEKDFEVLSIFVDSTIDKEVLEALPNLKCIATRSTGYDHIDLEGTKGRNIVVTTVPSYGVNTVAEFAFALILSLSRKLYQSVDSIRETGKYSFEGLEGFDLKGKTLGVVGAGRIGRHTIKMAKGFDMDVVAFDPYPKDEFAQELGFQYVSFEELLKKSDIVSIHVPFTKETEHLFNREKIFMMKKGALLINTARGAIVETPALVEALQKEHLGGAGLDVLEEEGVIKDEMGFVLRGDTDGVDVRTVVANHVLVDMPNVLLTPHTAFNTIEAKKRILDTTAENIVGFIKGEPKNVVK